MHPSSLAMSSRDADEIPSAGLGEARVDEIAANVNAKGRKALENFILGLLNAIESVLKQIQML